MDDTKRLMTHLPDNTTLEKIQSIHAWTENLFSFTISRPKHYRFIPGQFARLGVSHPQDPQNIIWRAYSIVSASYDEYLEFYSVVVPNGAFTSQLSQLQVGDSVFLDKTNHGFLTADRFNSGQDLWMLATGTGLAPFLSMLYEPDTWQRFKRIILVHSVRTCAELVYTEKIQQIFTHELLHLNNDRFYYQQIVTRESTLENTQKHVNPRLNQRLPILIQNQLLETSVNIPFSHENSRFMLCGNPQMVEDTRQALKTRGFLTHRKNQPGHVVVENYW